MVRCLTRAARARTVGRAPPARLPARRGCAPGCGECAHDASSVVVQGPAALAESGFVRAVLVPVARRHGITVRYVSSDGVRALTDLRAGDAQLALSDSEAAGAAFVAAGVAGAAGRLVLYGDDVLVGPARIRPGSATVLAGHRGGTAPDRGSGRAPARPTSSPVASAGRGRCGGRQGHARRAARAGGRALVPPRRDRSRRRGTQRGRLRLRVEALLRPRRPRRPAPAAGDRSGRAGCWSSSPATGMRPAAPPRSHIRCAPT